MPVVKVETCPVCPRSFVNSMAISRHMLSVLDAPHVKWIEDNGLNLASLIQEGNYKALANLLERTADIRQ